MALQKGHTDIAKFILKKGAKVPADKRSFKPLTYYEDIKTILSNMDESSLPVNFYNYLHGITIENSKKRKEVCNINNSQDEKKQKTK